MVKLIKLFITTILLISITSCKNSNNKQNSKQEENIKRFSVNDSISLKSIFYPERWVINNDSLWVINSRDSVFLKVFDLSNGDCILKWGNLGNGPDEYVSPGLIENFNEPGIGIYGNTERRMVSYLCNNGTLKSNAISFLPIWNGRLPKPYTRISSFNDSIMAGTYFLPRTAGIDIFNKFNEEIIFEFIPNVGKEEEDMSGPFEFKIATTDSLMAIAYRYLDLIEFIPLNSDFTPGPPISIGHYENQKKLYDEDRDDEMIKYFSDIQISDGYAYALYQGVQEKNLSDAETELKIYDLCKYKLVKTISLGRFFDQLLLRNNGEIILYSPENEDYLFKLII